MATKKDLVEAYSFSRRRLVTAFVSGAPGGREVEPARPGRAVIGGIAIAVLLLAGALVLKALGSPVSLDQTTPQLLSEKESGADYVLISSTGSEDDLELRPVINITSAMLLLGADIEPLVVSREKLSELTPGAQIGILQAPATPPPVDGLITTGWTACTGEVAGEPVGVKVNVTPTPAVVATPRVSFVVRSSAGSGAGAKRSSASGESLYLVSESPRGTLDGRPRAHVYEVPDAGDAVLGAVASSSAAEAVEVPADWLTTFPQGSALSLETFGLTRRDVGRTLPGTPSGRPPADLEVGDVVEVGTRSYLLTPRGEAVLLDAFMREVYLAVVPDGRRPKPGVLPPGVEIADSADFDDSRWPLAPTTERPTGELCSRLDAAPGEAPSVVLARAVPSGAASAEGIDAGQAIATVDSGAGAFVRSGDWLEPLAPTRVLVDDRAFAYGVAGETEATNLGYGAVPPVVVPDSWLELFNPGVLLSLDAARCPPTSQARARPCG